MLSWISQLSLLNRTLAKLSRNVQLRCGILYRMAKSTDAVKVPDSVTCSIERSLGVLGERWTFLILRQAFLGATRFAEFRDQLGVAPDVLSDRLATLVEFGV